MISIIVACSENNVIGKDNGLIWRLSNDLKRFKALTTGHAIVMGRKTFESIGRPLPNRRNIILSKNLEYMEGCEIMRSTDEVLELAKSTDGELFIIGGGQVYEQLLPFADKLYLTLVHTVAEGDTFFPALNRDEWTEVARESFKADEKNEFDYEFVDYLRRKI
ncbi:MAG: dihydrofolate reductase [Paludibacteraceae bacterium]|nr:dihydrofolate reductase [Paludibacteraceae bacterium]